MSLQCMQVPLPQAVSVSRLPSTGVHGLQVLVYRDIKADSHCIPTMAPVTMAGHGASTSKLHSIRIPTVHRLLQLCPRLCIAHTLSGLS